jgi:hypothetical protein
MLSAEIGEHHLSGQLDGVVDVILEKDLAAIEGSSSHASPDLLENRMELPKGFFTQP